MKVARDDVVVVVCGRYLITRDAGILGFCFESCISTTWIVVVVVVVVCGGSSSGGGSSGSVGPGICVLLFVSDILFSFPHFDVRTHDANSWVFLTKLPFYHDFIFFAIVFFDTVQKSNTTPEENHIRFGLHKQSWLLLHV